MPDLSELAGLRAGRYNPADQRIERLSPIQILFNDTGQHFVNLNLNTE